MTIINSADDYEHNGQAHCLNCGHLVVPPYMFWATHGGQIYLCLQCAHEIKAGFAADLIQLAAIHELRQVNEPCFTLARITNKEAKAADAKIVCLAQNPACVCRAVEMPAYAKTLEIRAAADTTAPCS